jgi:hypothetical protein
MGIAWVVSKKSGIKKRERHRPFDQERLISSGHQGDHYAVFMIGEPLSDHFELCPRCYGDII